MSSRFATQAVPLIHREAPLVQVKDGDSSVEQKLGSGYFTPKAPEDGVVTEVTGDFIRVGKDKVHIYNTMPLNEKCAVGSTQINVLKVDGLIWRGKMEAYEFVVGDKIQSINTHTKMSAWMPISGFKKLKNNKKLFKVSYRSGRSVTVTEDHSLVTLDDDGEMCRVLPEECEINKTRSPIAMFPEIPELESKSEFDTYEYGVLAGLYLSEGYINVKRKRIVLAQKPADRIKEIYDISCKTIPANEILSVAEYGVVIRNKKIYSWLLKSFGMYSNAKYIDSIIYSYSDKFLLGLISGYFGGDGYIRIDNKSIELSVSTVSKQLVGDIQDMLSIFGVFSTKRIGSNERYGNQRIYILTISCLDIQKIRDWFFFKDRNSIVEKINHESKYSTYNGIPTTTKSRKILKDGFFKVPAVVMKNTIINYVSKKHLLDNTSVFGDWARSDVMWDTVKSIEPAKYEEFVYDIEVAESHVFAVNNGLIIHNTYLHMTPTVKVGDHVKKGQALADSNFTKGETLALGTNLKTGYSVYKGWNHKYFVA